MAITYPLTLPTSPAPDSLVLRQYDVAGVSQSPWTGEQQIHEHQGKWWEAEISLPIMDRAGWAPWAATLGALKGRVGTFYLPAYLTTTPRGSASGSVSVDGAGQTGSELDVTGFTPSQTSVLLAGDFIQVGTQLFMVLTDADSDGSGDATLDIWPNLRSSPANGATVTLSNPKGLFRLTTPARDWQVLPGSLFGGIKLMAVEAF